VRGDGHAGSVTAFALATGAFFVTMLGTTLPTPLYPLFEERYEFGPLLVTVIFGIYAFGVIGGLILFGNLSDRLGRKPLLLLGLGLSAASALLFLVAGSLVPVYAARVVSGLSAGIFTGTATAYIIDLAPVGRRLASFVAVFANLGGLGTGTLLSGLLAEWAADPLRTPFAVDLGLVAVAAAGLLLGLSLPVIAAGVAIHYTSLRSAGLAFCAAAGLLSLAVLASQLRSSG
jgi:MFS family permease